MITRHSPKLASLIQLFVARLDGKLQGKQSVSKLCCLSQKRKFARQLSEITSLHKPCAGHKFRKRGANQTYRHEVLELLKRRNRTSAKNQDKKGRETFSGKEQAIFLTMRSTQNGILLDTKNSCVYPKFRVFRACHRGSELIQ